MLRAADPHLAYGSSKGYRLFFTIDISNTEIYRLSAGDPFGVVQDSTGECTGSFAIAEECFAEFTDPCFHINKDTDYCISAITSDTYSYLHL